MKLIYLSAPYSTGPDPMTKRQKDINKATAWLMANTDSFVFSPITYEQPIKEINGVNPDQNVEWAFWRPRDAEMVARCDELWVLCLRNWENSRGVNFEIGEAHKSGKPIRYIQVEEILQNCPNCGGSGETGPGWAGGACSDCGGRGQIPSGDLIFRGEFVNA